MSNLNEVIQLAAKEIEESKNLDELEKTRIKFFGKSGLINQEMKNISKLDVDQKKEVGKKLNLFKSDFNIKFNHKKDFFEKKKIQEKIENDFIDPTLPERATKFSVSKVHPITQTTEEIISILGSMGLKYVEGPDIEDDFHNFTALNIPLDHPARQMHDTFYIETKDSNRNVLRTHTSPVQIRSLKNEKVPIKIFAPGRTYRCDSDITHTPMFHQVEGLVVDKDISFSNLKWFISEFCKTFFNNESLKLRFRPSFFPFTEPSAEVDVNCSRKKGKLILGEGDEWMEILGCGMVHPNVFKISNFSNEGATGFAFGIGIERLAMLKYGMPDLRNFFENDIRWLNHYGFSCFDTPDLNWD
jgi:phenylalanyl-tRNA synthetase alpha chain